VLSNVSKQVSIQHHFTSCKGDTEVGIYDQITEANEDQLQRVFNDHSISVWSIYENLPLNQLVELIEEMALSVESELLTFHKGS